MPKASSSDFPAASSSAPRPSERACAMMFRCILGSVTCRPSPHQVLAYSAGTATTVHVEHANQKCASFLRLDYIMRGKNARHVPYFKVFLNVRQRVLEALVACRQVMHDARGKHRVHETDLGCRP